MRNVFIVLIGLVFLLLFGSFDGQRGVLGCIAEHHFQAKEQAEALESVCNRPVVVKCDCSCPLFPTPAK